MSGVGSAAAWCLAGCVVLAGALPAAAQADGKAVYDRWCAACHGEDGRGNGPAANTMLPRPRDFTAARYQIRTTGTGELPTDADILHVIDVGMPGTAMPGWQDVLSNEERLALVQYVKAFSPFFASSPAPAPLTFGDAPDSSDERIARGREVYELIECNRCHGAAGRGDGPSAPTLKDDAGFPVAAADLTKNWRFNGGGTTDDIYRRLRTGLDGTPMPSFSDLVDAGVVTDDDLWSLTHYVRSLSPEDPPGIQEVIVARWAPEGGVPATAEDERWTGVERFYVPMAGQIMLAPRWFNPRVDGLWVQAMHDGTELAVLVSWSDPSESPATDWGDYVGRVLTTMASTDAGTATGPGPSDQLTVQFPQAPSEGMERPFFLQGDSRRPAYLWAWQSGAGGAVEAVARGLGSSQAQEAGLQQVTASAVHRDGEWRVLFRRALLTEDEEDLQFSVGTAIPVAFQAWDADNGEQGMQGSVSTWYFLALEQPTPVTVFVAPALALALTFGLGLLVISRARREQTGGPRSADE
jgi:mono/diheme cytochrome c family protein